LEHVDGDDDDDDDDESGGISITAADLQHYAAPSPPADTPMADHDAVMQLQSVMAQLETFPHVGPAASFGPLEPLPSYQMPSILHPIPHVFSGPTSSSDAFLEPLPTLQEAHLSIEDNGSFAPITSFFHRIAPEKPTVPGLDLVHVPASIAREHLQGDRLDPQGIDWSIRNTTRSHVRAKRVECEGAKLSCSSHEVRKVCHPPVVLSRCFLD
jgi:hypothetical protein